MKKFLCFIVVLCLIIQGNIIAVQAAPTVKKTSIVSVKQVGKQSIKIQVQKDMFFNIRNQENNGKRKILQRHPEQCQDWKKA